MQPRGDTMKSQVAFTLRFDPGFYERVKTVSRCKGWSVSAFVHEAVARKLAEEDDALLFRAFTIVGEDASVADVEFAHDAQKEAALKDG